MHMSDSIQGPEVSEVPKAGVIGNHESPSVGAGNLTSVLYKSSTHS